MAAAASSPSPSTQDQPPPPPSSRRLPPPCWSHEETVALIDSYCEKWYSLRRGNLRAPHWQEVADAVAARCPLSSGNPPKTSVQCRHKMEKLRKRYRSEVQRAASAPNAHRFSSSWVHFKRMESMEKGPSSSSATAIPVNYDEQDEDDYQSSDVKHGNGIGGGFRIRIPNNRSSSVGTKMYNSPPPPNYGFTTSGVVKDGKDSSERFGMGGKKRGGDGARGVGKKKELGDPIGEMVSAIKVLGDGFVRMERMKMEMAREVEGMRMEMELKRTEMILDSQQRIVDAFANAFSDNNNNKKKLKTRISLSLSE